MAETGFSTEGLRLYRQLEDLLRNLRVAQLFPIFLQRADAEGKIGLGHLLYVLEMRGVACLEGRGLLS